MFQLVEVINVLSKIVLKSYSWTLTLRYMYVYCGPYNGYDLYFRFNPLKRKRIALLDKIICRSNIVKFHVCMDGCIDVFFVFHFN